MTRVALTGTIGAAVLVVALGLFFAIYQQDQDDGTETGTAETATDGQPAAGDAQAITQDGQNQGGVAGSDTTQQAALGQQPTAGQDAAAAGAGTTVPPSFDVVRVNPSGDTVIAGRAEPGAKVTILDRGAELGTVEADGRGEWVFLPDAALVPGQHDFTLESTNDGAQKQESETSVVVIVPEVAKDIAGRASDQPAGALAIEVPKSGEGPTRVLNVPSDPSASSGTATQGPEIAAIDYDAEGRAMLSGRAPAGARLFVYVDNQPAGEAVVAEDGTWSFVPKTAIAPGLHVIRIDQVDESGKVLARAEIPFEQATFPGAASTGATQLASGGDSASETVTDAAGTGETGSVPQIMPETIVVQPGNSLWKLARESYGTGVRYTVIYEANKDQIANPDLIYPGQIFSVPPEN